jgi:hypothetical protein
MNTDETIDAFRRRAIDLDARQFISLKSKARSRTTVPRTIHQSNAR